MQKISRYVLSGGIATVTSLLLTYLLTETAGLWYVLSSIVGFSAAICISFLLQKFWTFRNTEMTRVRMEAAQFVLVALGSLALDAVAVYGLVEYVDLHYLLAQFFIGCFIAVGNFIFYHMIFRGAARRSLLVLWREELSEWERALVVAGGTALFLVTLKLFGVDLPYHQDEWKTARVILEGATAAGAFFHHPPLTGLLFRGAGTVLPPELLRLLPLFFTALCSALLYLVVEARAGVRAAFLSLIFFGTVAYGTLAALMLDTDGAILPFFFLFSVYAYDRILEGTNRMRYIWGGLLIVALIGGFLIKLSFVLVIGALTLDYLFARRHNITMREVWALAGAVALLGGAFLSILAFARFFSPAFDLEAMISHALSYVHGSGRAWGQIAFQAAKAVIYIGPLSFVWVAFASRETFERSRVFLIYLALGFVFYFVLFDFSTGALDKYLMFSIVPLCVIAAVALAPYIPKRTELNVVYLAMLALAACALCAVNFIPHDVLPLYPKSAWAKEVLAFHWNILLPFMGGSGPAGFYVSFLFIALSFIAGACVALLAFIKPALRHACAGALIVLTMFYAGVFTEELFFGKINGSTPKVLNDAIAYIHDSEEVTSVITHNDIGAFELWQMGKYGGRFYAVPGYEEGHKELFADHTGQFLVVDLPRWSESSFYARFFAPCTSRFTSSSGAVSARVYECPEGKMVE